MTTKTKSIMNKRRLLWLAVIAMVIGLAVVVWVFCGRINHEHFYQGRPTSYWREQLKGEDGSRPWRALLHRVKSVITLGQRSKRTVELLSEGGPAVVPVLMELLRDDDEYVRFWAAQSLLQLTTRKEPAVPEDIGSQPDALVSCLIEALKDEHNGVRATAACTLRIIGGEAKAAVPGLVEALKDKHAGVRAEAAMALGSIGLEPQSAKAAIPSLIEALKDKDPLVRSGAAGSLGIIQPEPKEAVPGLMKTSA